MIVLNMNKYNIPTKYLIKFLLLFCVIIFISSNCNKEENMTKTDLENIPEHLKHFPGLYIRKDEQIINAPNEDIIVAQSYPTYKDKGAIVKEQRLTIITAKNIYKVNEEIRIIHIYEAIESGYEVYVMGPKPIYNEYIDNELMTKPLPESEDPLIPSLYNGAVLSSPAVDYNYDITSYTFDEIGTHKIYWELGFLKSNIIILEIVP